MSFGRRHSKLAQHRTLEQTENYWRNPDDGSNQPENYLNPKGGHARSLFLIELIADRVDPLSGALEVGCNVGRNLQHLADHRWAPLAGIEINPEAVQMLRERQADLHAAHIQNAPAESALAAFDDRSFGLVFTMAVLVHIHPDVAEAVFDGMARVCDHTLIVIEDEHTAGSWRHFKRDYKPIFQSRGLAQVHQERCGTAKSGLPGSYVARVFKADAG